MRSRRRWGATLAEVLVSLAVMGSCLSIMGGLFARASHSMGVQEDKAEAARALRAAGVGIAAEIEQALADDSLKPEGSRLTLLRVAPPVISDLAQAVASNPEPTPKKVVKVTYTFDPQNRTLVRECGSGSWVIARELQAFSCASRPAGAVEVRMLVSTGSGGTATFTQTVLPQLRRLPGAEEVRP